MPSRQQCPLPTSEATNAYCCGPLRCTVNTSGDVAAGKARCWIVCLWTDRMEPGPPKPRCGTRDALAKMVQVGSPGSPLRSAFACRNSLYHPSCSLKVAQMDMAE